MTRNSRDKLSQIAIFGAFCESAFREKAKNCETLEKSILRIKHLNEGLRKDLDQNLLNNF